MIRPAAVRVHAICIGTVIGLLLGAHPAPAQTTQPAAQPVPVYDEQADAHKQIAAALTRAQRKNQRVLVMFGGNWCGWCRKLHGLFTTNKDVARLLQYEYQLVLVDVGRFDKHMDIAKGYGVDLKQAGVPFLTVLDAAGKVLANQETGALESGEKHDVSKVTAFLMKWKAPALDARDVLAAGRARAVTEKKRVFVRLSAPWCIWCHRLSEFLARQDIAALLAADYVDVLIDIDRMANGKAVARELRASEEGGIPWFAILDADGKSLVTADGPDGNIGFPVKPAEVEHFGRMLRQTAQRLTAAQVSQIEQALRAAAERQHGSGPAPAH